MNKTARWMIPLILEFAGITYWIVSKPEPAAPEVKAVVTSRVEAPHTGEQPEVSIPLSAPEPIQEVVPPVESAPPEPLPAAAPPAVYSTNDLMVVLPLWMLEEAEADIFAEERVVAGRQITRVRGSYAWPNGSQMEVEISDLGPRPSDLLLRSLGYNTRLEDTVSETGFQLHSGTGTEPEMFEYDYENREGGLQMLIADRFLVEVKLEVLPEESFDLVIENQVPIALLEQMAAGN